MMLPEGVFQRSWPLKKVVWGKKKRNSGLNVPIFMESETAPYIVVPGSH